MLGESGFEGGKVNGSKLSATAVTDLQGQQVEFVIVRQQTETNGREHLIFDAPANACLFR